MQTKIRLRVTLFATVLLLLGLRAQAQQILCDNLLNCDVTIFYEMYESNPITGTCVVTCSGSFLIQANTTGNILPDCTSTNNPCDACIIITDIGGWAPPNNHSSNNVGHIMTPYGQSGNTGSGSCAPGTPYTATQSTGSWIIQ